MEAQTGSRQLTPPLQDQGRAVIGATLLPHLTPAERASPLRPQQGGQASHVYSVQFGACFLTTRHSTKPMASTDCWEEVGRYPGFPAAPNGRSLGSTDLCAAIARQWDTGSGPWFCASPSSAPHLPHLDWVDSPGK